MWLVTGVIAFVAVVLNIIFLFNKRYKYCIVLVWISLSSGLIVLLSMYRLINLWVQAEDMSSLMDVVPTMSNVLAGIVLIGIILNAIVVFVHYKKASN